MKMIGIACGNIDYDAFDNLQIDFPHLLRTPS
jgi:hypothetical protein